MRTVRFLDLAPGLHDPTTKIWFRDTTGPFNSLTQHEVLYVNRPDKEIVLEIFGKYKTLGATEFNKMGYRIERSL